MTKGRLKCNPRIPPQIKVETNNSGMLLNPDHTQKSSEKPPDFDRSERTTENDRQRQLTRWEFHFRCDDEAAGARCGDRRRPGYGGKDRKRHPAAGLGFLATPAPGPNLLKPKPRHQSWHWGPAGIIPTGYVRVLSAPGMDNILNLIPAGRLLLVLELWNVEGIRMFIQSPFQNICHHPRHWNSDTHYIRVLLSYSFFL